MDNIKNVLRKIKFEDIIKYVTFFLIILIIYVLIDNLSKKSVELFNNDNCGDIYLLNYGTKSISSIVIDKKIRYGFFKDIKEVKSNYYDISIGIQKDSDTGVGPSLIISLNLFKADSFENPIVITPSKFKFINNDKEYDTIKDGYDFSNSLFIFKVNNFVASSTQNYGTILDNDIYELRLIEKNNNSTKQVFNLRLINKLIDLEYGMDLDPSITNIELNKYYIASIIINKIRHNNKKICLSLIAIDQDKLGKNFYQKPGTFRISKINEFSSNKQTTLKCKNTVIGLTQDQLELTGNSLTNTVPSLNIDFGFIEIGGKNGINLAKMPEYTKEVIQPIVPTIEESISDAAIVKKKTESKYEALIAAKNYLNTFENDFTNDIIDTSQLNDVQKKSLEYTDNHYQTDYRGIQNRTKDGKICQNWSIGEPNPRSRELLEDYPSAGLGEHNYCRNPDNDLLGIWCYTTETGDDVDFPYGYCNPIDIQEEINKEDQSDYKGFQNITRDGKECVAWEDTNNSDYRNLNSNFCRNPDNDENGIWCYTKNDSDELEKGYCDPISVNENFTNVDQNINENFTNNINDDYIPHNYINLSGLKDYLNMKKKDYLNISQKNDDLNNLLALFHYNYIKILESEIDNLIKLQIDNNRCTENDLCAISIHMMPDDINNTIKDNLESYIIKVFNSKRSGKNNAFIKYLIINDKDNNIISKVTNEINDTLIHMNKMYNLPINFKIKLNYLKK